MKQTMNPAVARVLKRLHYPLDVILMCVRWYVAYPLSLRHLEEMMAERGIAVDIRLCTAGHLSCYRYWGRYLAGTSGPSGRAGEWTRPTSGSRANGGISTVQSTRTATLSIFCCAPSAIRLRPGVSLRNRSLVTVFPRR